MDTAYEYLFVYGTLCKRAIESKHDFMLPEAEFVTEAFLQAELYLVDYYPAVVDSNEASNRVRGELYRFTESNTLFKKLDDYEGCGAHSAEPHEYRREKRTVQLPSGEHTDAWVYVFNLAINDFIRIASGDFIEYQKLSNQQLGES